MDRLFHYLRMSERIPGWTRGAEAESLARHAFAAPDGAVIVEIGAFLGSGTVLLAGARKLKRSGMVHTVDPFDGSGDDYSLPFYREILAAEGTRPQQQRFERAIADAGLQRWVQAHAGAAEAIAQGWTAPVDLLYLDGDQSPEGVSRAFAAWRPHLRAGAILALHNSIERIYDVSHDGHYQLAQQLATTTGYDCVEWAGSTSYWRVLS